MTKTVPYTVVQRIDGVEIRKYPRIALATVHGLPDDDAFTVLFRYISGQNESRRRIAMTAPVVSAQVGERIPMAVPVVSGNNSFSFVLPTRYNSESAPAPIDTRARIEDVLERHVAVLRFRGKTTITAVDIRTKQLIETLGRRNIATVGEPFLMRYNPPFTPGFLRRNEIGIAVELSRN